jgi:hypothetical protein
MTADGIQLSGHAGDETRLLSDRRCGYSLPIPGRPESAGAGVAGAADLTVRLSDAPIELAFRLDELPGGTSGEPLAQALALAYATGRARTEPQVHLPRGRNRGAGIDGAAAALYPVLGDEPRMEQVHVSVLSRDGGSWAMVRTLRFPNRAVKTIVWAHFQSAIAGADHWEPAAPRSEAPPLWPNTSTFAEPGVALRLLPELAEDTRRKAAALSVIPAGEGAALVELLVAFGNNPDPPRFEIHRFVLDTAAQRLAAVVPFADVAAALVTNLYEVRTSHDFRAWVWQCLVAFDRRHAA